MEIRRIIDDVLANNSKETKRFGEMHLMIVAIDPKKFDELKSATFHFSNKEKGLEVFDDLVTTAGSVDYLGST